jgi:hypothetical protein
MLHIWHDVVCRVKRVAPEWDCPMWPPYGYRKQTYARAASAVVVAAEG